KICGNFTGPTDGANPVWLVDPPTPSDYFQGTFEVFNASNTSISAEIARTGLPVLAFTVPPLTTISRSVTNPTSLVITSDPGETGKYCIILYKRAF
ncbi:S-Ena type endospore appendage, partial [Peribacillus frigoritolerans]